MYPLFREHQGTNYRMAKQSSYDMMRIYAMAQTETDYVVDGDRCEPAATTRMILLTRVRRNI